MSEQETKIEQQETNATQNGKGLGLLTTILTLASYGFLFLRYVLVYAVDTYDAMNVCRILFFVFAFACVATSAVITFVIKKENKLDAMTVLNILALFLCFN